MYLFSPVQFSFTTDNSGSVTGSIQIPGTYSGLLPSTTSSGRYLEKFDIWSPDGVDGDNITMIKITDTNSVMPAQDRARCPNYPDVVQFYDGVNDGPAGLTNGFLLPVAKSGLATPPYLSSTVSIQPLFALQYMPAQLFLSFLFTAGAVASGRVVRGNITWARWVPG